MRFITPLVIIVLIVTAGILGYAVYNQFTSTKEPVETTSSQPSTAQNQILILSTPTSSPVPKAVALTEDEQAALKTPGINATEEEKRKYAEAAIRAAKDAALLDIGQCQGKPVVLRVKEKQTLTVNNPDPENHTIVVDKDHMYSVPANGEKDIVIDFGKGIGLYGYGCDTSQETRGVFLVKQ